MKKRPKGNFNQVLAPVLFLLPNALIFTIFIIIPAFQGLRMSVYQWGVFSEPHFVGLSNFIELLSDKVFWRTFQNTLVYSVCVVPLLVVTALILALILQRNSMHGVRTFRSMFYIPSLLSMITVGIAWRFMLGDEMGIINYLLRSWGLQGIGWLTNGNLAMASVIFCDGLGRLRLLHDHHDNRSFRRFHRNCTKPPESMARQRARYSGESHSPY